MGFFDFLSFEKTTPTAIKRNITLNMQSASSLYNQQIFHFAGRFGIPYDYTLKELTKHYGTNSVIYSLMDWKAQKMSQVKPMLLRVTNEANAKEFRKWNGVYIDGYERIKLKQLRTASFDEIHLQNIGKDSELYKLRQLFTSPNEWATWKEFLYMYSAFMDASGFALTWADRVKIGPNKGKSLNWYLLPSHEMEIIGGDIFNPVTGYALTSTRYQDRNFEKEDVMHLKTFSFNYDGYGSHLKGTSKIAVALSEVLTFIEAKNREYYGFKTGDSATILSPKDPLNIPENLNSPTGLQTFKDNIFKSLRQKDRHNAAIVTMALEAIKLDSPLKDSKTTDVKKEIKENLCKIWHISPRVMGSTDGSTYNNIKEDVKMSLRDGVFSELIQFSEAINEFEINPNYSGYELALDFDVFDELTEEIGAQFEYLSKADFLSADEKRIWMGYAPLGLPNSDKPEKFW